MGKAQIEELKSQCAANSPWYPATGSVANGIEVVVMASAMSDLFTVSFVAASLVLRISVRGRQGKNPPGLGDNPHRSAMALSTDFQ